MWIAIHTKKISNKNKEKNTGSRSGYLLSTSLVENRKDKISYTLKQLIALLDLCPLSQSGHGLLVHHITLWA